MRLCSVLGLWRGRWRRGLRLVADETGIVRENTGGETLASRSSASIDLGVPVAVRCGRIAVRFMELAGPDHTDDPCVNSSLDMVVSLQCHNLPF